MNYIILSFLIVAFLFLLFLVIDDFKWTERNQKLVTRIETVLLILALGFWIVQLIRAGVLEYLNIRIF